MSTRKRLPLLVIISGAPGAGKSTLARKLADYMRLLHIERDAFCESIARTKGGTINRSLEAVPLYFDGVKYLLEQSLSLITDGTLYRNKSEKDIRAHWLPVARIVNVHCRAKDEYKRFYEREVARAGGEPDWLARHMDHLREIYANTVDPLELGCPVIEVDSTAEYVPPIADIATRITDIYTKQKEGIR